MTISSRYTTCLALHHCEIDEMNEDIHQTKLLASPDAINAICNWDKLRAAKKAVIEVRAAEKAAYHSMLVYTEIIQMEITFNKQLQSGLELFRPEMEKHRVLDRKTMDILFGGVAAVLAMSDAVLHELLLEKMIVTSWLCSPTQFVHQ